MPDLPDEAVEAAARALYLHEHGTYVFANEAWLAGMEGNEKWQERARAALTAAAPYIAAQATTDLRAGIEALRDEWRAVADRLTVLATMHSDPDTYTARITMLISHADALAALLRKGE